MTKQTWIIAGILSALVVAGVVGLSFWQKNQRLARVQAELAEATQAAEKARTEKESLKNALDEKDARIAALQQETQQATQAQKNLEQEMRKAIESKDVTISELQGKLTVNILDRILFDSGEAELKPEGMQVLDQVGKVLAQFPNRQIHVIGHTDNVPIRASARTKYPSNWELSTARATAAVRYLGEKGGIAPHRMGAVGYGEFHPLADNATPEGRAKNRRIAIVVLSEELVGADTAVTAVASGLPAAVNPEATNAAPAVPSTPAATNNPSPAVPTVVTNSPSGSETSESK
jgi:chemotaxis protein MotB